MVQFTRNELTRTVNYMPSVFAFNVHFVLCVIVH